MADSEVIPDLEEPPKDEFNGELSDNDLKIDLDTRLISTPTKTFPKSPTKTSRLSPSKNDLLFIETIENEIEKQLTEKAEKSNLTVTNVKSIIRQVLTNEHVKNFLEKSTSDDDMNDLLPFQPKLTRSKAKELMSANAIQIDPVQLPWVPQPPTSEARVLIGEDLKEDDSGYEYIPGEESDDDHDESVTSESEIGSLPPPTPPTPVCMEDQATQTTNYDEDGVFKIPAPISTAQEATSEDAANIALRTRSKINLSSTPLEAIEKSFIPPDIPKDMLEVERDDDEEWNEFLKGFMEPLEEATKPTEDDELDPEYNILADAQIDKIDNEDFRMDRATKITKKEVKNLWDELFEYLHDISENGCEDINKNKSKYQQCINELVDDSFANMTGASEATFVKQQEDGDCSTNCLEDRTLQNYKLDIGNQQIAILQQQLRQHVQMLTQNFLLSYEHPEYHQNSVQTKEYLLNFKFLGEAKTSSSSISIFTTVNLMPALHLIDQWVALCATNSESVKTMREHVRQELIKSISYKMSGNFDYVLTFPELLLETMSKSHVFLYPTLLPRIPFKSEQFSRSYQAYTDAEDELLVFGLNQFKKFLTEDLKVKKVTLKSIVTYVQEYMMPHRSVQSILKHIFQCKHPRCAKNPIQQYILYNRVKPMMHYIYPWNPVLPPYKRRPEELPHLWKQFIYPNHVQNITTNLSPFSGKVILLDNSLSTSTLYSSPILVTSTPTQIRQFNLVPNKPRTKIKKCLSHSFSPSPKKLVQNFDFKKSVTTLEKLLSIFLQPISIQKLIRYLADLDCSQEIINTPEKVFYEFKLPKKPNNLLSMPTLNTPVKLSVEESSGESIRTNKAEGSAMPSGDESKKSKCAKNMEFSTIKSSSFQKENTSMEVEFCRNAEDIQICQTSQSNEQDVLLPNTSGYSSGKDNSDDINLPLASSAGKPETKSGKKELSGTEKKKNKLRKDFLANLSIATPDDADTEKHKNEMFAVAYYDKLRETLDLEDYHKVMQILNKFSYGDVVDLYNELQVVLRPKYSQLAEEFLFFLREKEANAVGQLIPWLELHTRVKFLRKLEVFLKDQPVQLKKIYNILMELTKTENLTMDKIKSMLVPMLKGNTILLDLFLQGFKYERPPASLLEGPYETIDVNKELARPEGEESYETFVVPNTEDKYGGPNCICHCHSIEDMEYKGRHKHCNACGLKFVNGNLYLSVGRGFQRATVTFKTNPHLNHNVRLLGKTTPSTSTQKKKRCDSSPSKLPPAAASSSGKDTLEEDTEDEDMGKRKRSVSQKSPRKRKKTEPNSRCQDKSASPKKSPGRNAEVAGEMQAIKPRKRTNSGRKTNKKEDVKKIEAVETESETPIQEEPIEAEAPLTEEFEIVEEIEQSEHDTSEEQQEKLLDDCMDSSGESLEKPLSPGQQTNESESEIYLEESSQDNYESDESSSSTESAKGSQSDSNTNYEPWKREEDTIILETLQKEDDKEYALQIISDKLPNRTVSQIRNRLSRLMNLLIETLKNT